MSKGNRVRAQRQSAPARATHEPVVPVNWPEGHVKVELTGDQDNECFKVTIHGVPHFLHSTTARALHEELGKKLDEWNADAREYWKSYGIAHEDI
jgi:hypothetical protein